MVDAVIGRIDKTSVHRICAGQVITDLAGCIKELVENSLDANASSIEVRISSDANTFESLSVSDNGSGIIVANHAALCLKHCTSKLTSFDGLSSLSSFGFRGEALCSLCAVSGGITVITSSDPDGVGHKLIYDNLGKLISSVSAPRERGTTVIVKNIFASMPVRLKEFSKNFKREQAKCIDIVQAFAIISTNIRISFISASAKTGSKILFVQTSGNPSVKLNFSNVFGTKHASQLVDIRFEVSADRIDIFENDTCASDQIESNSDENGDDDEMSVDGETLTAKKILVEGLISRPSLGNGRSSNDHQFFFVNNRPCDLPKLAKLVNEVYKTYNLHQYPVIVWNLLLDPDLYDVNVSPNKRMILLHNEKIVFENIKNKLDQIFTPNRIYAVSKFSASTPLSDVEIELPASEKPVASTREFCCDHTSESSEHADDSISHIPTPKRIRLANENLVLTYISSDPNESPKNHPSSVAACTPIIKENVLKNANPPATAIPAVITKVQQPLETSPKLSLQSNSTSQRANTSEPVLQPRKFEARALKSAVEWQQINTDRAIAFMQNNTAITQTPNQIHEIFKLRRTQRRDRQNRGNPGPGSSTENTKEKPEFSPVTTTLANNDPQAIDQLSRQIRKQDFLEMRVVGQFNLGFIIVELRGDLFVVDQHASDEKWNYEDLRKGYRVS
ncbi:Mismatch repair endonuclease pms2, partial [Physocladia obscura]